MILFAVSELNVRSTEIAGAKQANSKASRLRRSARFAALLLAGTALVGVTVADPAQAQSWTGAVSNNWFTTGNWSTNAVPTAGGAVTIDTVVPNATGINGNAVSGNIDLGVNGTGMVTVTGGSTLTVTGHVHLGVNAGSSGGLILDSSQATTSAEVNVGGSGTGTLIIQNSGGLIADSVNVGSIGGGSSATVDGVSSFLQIQNQLQVGGVAAATLTIANGAALTTGDVTEIGVNAGDTGTITVSGTGTTWTTSSQIYVGGAGTGTLHISGGAVVTGASADVGAGTGSNGTVTVAGSGSTWALSQDLNVGSLGTGTVLISGGGAVTSTNGYLGASSAANGTVGIDGSGSSWTLSNQLQVGSYGTGALTISNGASVSDLFAFVGNLAGTSGTATVDGTGSTWTSTQSVTVGNSGTGTLHIQNGGTVNALGLVIANNAGSNGTVTIGTGASLMLDTTSGDLTVGYLGTGSLSITSGGIASVLDGQIGGGTGGIGTATVDGTGSRWTNTGDLAIGTQGTGSLTISNGGTVTDTTAAFMGQTSTGSGTVTVTGAGSSWVSGGAIHDGYGGTGVLTISNGGSVTSTYARLGELASSNGTATVTGAGSTWSTGTGDMIVGLNGAGALHIASGGAVSNGAGEMGALPGSSAVVTVDGTGSSWANAGSIVAGDRGTATVTISGGGVVSSSGGIVGNLSTSVGTVTVTGTNSTWTNSTFLKIANNGGIGTVTIANGGVVTAPTGTEIANDTASIATLNIGAAAGSAAAAPGTLSTPSVAFGPGTGAITFNHTSANYTFAPAISGLGSINQIAGVTILSADSSGFTGTTTISGGTLLVNGKLGAPIAVTAGGTLGGSGVAAGAVSVASGSTLLGVQGQTLTLGSLSLGAAANINVTLGGPGTTTLFNVVNDLTLAGYLNINAVPGFGAGLYRIMTYGGVLTDNGLAVGMLPAGASASDFTVQTSVAGQVNLINSATGTSTFWDGGATGSANNGVVDGGTGTWTATSTTWTDAAGLTNGALPQPGFAVFAAPGGTVTVDTSAGAIAVTGMQFASDGYRVVGGPISLSGALATIRVGDGTAAGASFTATIGSPLIGAAGLDKTDLGTLVLTGANTYTGPTSISGGTLALSGSGSIAASSGLTNNGNFDISATTAGASIATLSGTGTVALGAQTLTLATASGSFDGTLSGSGGLTLVSGSQTLTGANTFTGTTTILGGILQLGNGGTSGSLAGPVVDNGSLVFNRSDASSFAGAISGSGSVVQGGAGTTTLAGVNSYTGGTTISAGTLVGSATSFGSGGIADTGALVLDQPTNASFANVLSGTGSLTKLGAGSLNLTGASPLSGATTVAAGLLSVNGSLSNSIVTILSGGALGGNGQVAGVIVASGGIVAPGNSIGTLTIAGKYTAQAGSIYQVQLTSTGQSDLINVSGTAVITSGALLSATKIDAASYVAGTKYTVLTAAGGITGTYTLSGSSSTFFTTTLTEDATDIYLNIGAAKPLVASAATPNQRAAATGLASLPTTNAITTAVLALPSDLAAQSAFDQISGEVHASLKTAEIEDSRFIRDAAINRLRAAFDAPGSAPSQTFGPDGKSIPVAGDPDHMTLWGQGFGSWSTSDGDGNAAALRRSTGGFLVGGDVLVDMLRLGALAGYSRSSANVDARNASATVDNFHIGLFGGTQFGALGLRAGTAYTWHDIRTNRVISFAGFGDGPSAHYAANTLQAFGDVGYRIDAGRSALGSLALEPFGSLAYVNLATGGFGESGGAAALTGRSGGTDVTFGTFGLRSTATTMVGTVAVTTRASIGWRRAYGDLVPTSSQSFAGGSTFVVAGVPIARDSLALDTGLDVALSDRFKIGLSYAGQIAGHAQDHSVKANLSWSY